MIEYWENIRRKKNLTWTWILSANHGRTFHVHPQRIGAKCNRNRHEQNTIHLRERIRFRKATNNILSLNT